jgi:hypothetical protein
MRRTFLKSLTLEQLHDLRWAVYWESGTMLNKSWFNWVDKQGIIKVIFDLMKNSDSFNRWDVEEEIKTRMMGQQGVKYFWQIHL